MKTTLGKLNLFGVAVSCLAALLFWPYSSQIDSAIYWLHVLPGFPVSSGLTLITGLTVMVLLCFLFLRVVAWADANSKSPVGVTVPLMLLLTLMSLLGTEAVFYDDYFDHHVADTMQVDSHLYLLDQRTSMYGVIEHQVWRCDSLGVMCQSLGLNETELYADQTVTVVALPAHGEQSALRLIQTRSQ